MGISGLEFVRTLNLQILQRIHKVTTVQLILFYIMCLELELAKDYLSLLILWPVGGFRQTFSRESRYVLSTYLLIII